MKLEHSFEVEAPLDVVWAALIDVERVAPCLPGASITEAGDDGVYRGEFTVKLGPTTASYRGQLELAEQDDSAHRATMRASGQDKRGQGSAKATIVSVLSESGDATRVATETDFTITGRLARFGRGGMIKDVSNRLLRDFSDCLAETIGADQGERAGGEEPAEADADAAAGAAAASPTKAAGADSETATKPATGAGAAAESTGASTPRDAGSPASTARAPAPHPRPAARPAKPVKGFSLLLSVLWERIKRLFGRGGH